MLQSWTNTDFMAGPEFRVRVNDIPETGILFLTLLVGAKI